jgi:hypothetical protein
MMSTQADQVCCAGYGERSEDRTNRRNGYRAREWDTRAGTVELAIPKLRAGSFYPDWLLTHRRRAEQALVTVVATAYLLGVSTRRVERLTKQLGGQVSVAVAGLGYGQPPRRPAAPAGAVPVPAPVPRRVPRHAPVLVPGLPPRPPVRRSRTRRRPT